MGCLLRLIRGAVSVVLVLTLLVVGVVVIRANLHSLMSGDLADGAVHHVFSALRRALDALEGAATS